MKTLSEHELQELLTLLDRYAQEEHAQAQVESDERRRAWHDGRASAFESAAQRLHRLVDVTLEQSMN